MEGRERGVVFEGNGGGRCGMTDEEGLRKGCNCNGFLVKG